MNETVGMLVWFLVGPFPNEAADPHACHHRPHRLSHIIYIYIYIYILEQIRFVSSDTHKNYVVRFI